MTVWIHSPFDNLPEEGFRPQRYRLMAEAFAAKGDSVVYFTSDFNHGTKKRRELIRTVGTPVTLKLVPTPTYARNVSLKRVFSHLVYARRLAKSLCGKPDLIITATPTLSAAKTLFKYARKVGAKFVVDIQDAWPETFERLGLPRFALLPMYRTARHLYREADLVTGVSERYRAISAREDYRLFYHGILASSAASRENSFDVRRLVYIGNLGVGYDLATVLRALAKDTSLTLDIAGKGPREATLKRLAEELKIDSRVRFHGYLAEKELKELLCASSVGVIPMRDDSWVGLPYKLGDYLAAGLPVVSSLNGECGELLRREKLGAVYERESVDSFLEALRDLPCGPVVLPEVLRAELIYEEYANLLRY